LYGISVNLIPIVRAEDEFGCKFLLCAVSENPSWRGVPYRVPIMAKLYSMMKAWSFSWPICSSAGTGSPGYEQYDDCPEGWTAAVIDAGSKSGVLSACGDYGQHVCQRETQAFFWMQWRQGFRKRSNWTWWCELYPDHSQTIAGRSLLFDIPDHKRVYFSVR
jgi:hypothetical protein